MGIGDPVPAARGADVLARELAVGPFRVFRVFCGRKAAPHRSYDSLRAAVLCFTTKRSGSAQTAFRNSASDAVPL